MSAWSEINYITSMAYYKSCVANGGDSDTWFIEDTIPTLKEVADTVDPQVVEAIRIVTAVSQELFLA